MPAQPAWFHHLDQILAGLRALPASHLDRLAVQNLFGVRQRRARQLMTGLPGLRVGNAFAVDRLALLARLEATAAGQPFRHEIARRARLAGDLDHTRRLLAARRVRLPVPAPGSLPGLPAGVHLQPRELRIEFHGAEDLAAKLYALSQTMAGDWPGFVQSIG